MYKQILLPLSLLIASLVSFNSISPEKEIILEKEAYQLKATQTHKGFNLFDFNTSKSNSALKANPINNKWESLSLLLLFVFMIVNLFILNSILIKQSHKTLNSKSTVV